MALVGGAALAQDLEAGKPAPQLFSANCSACHKTPQGLARGRNVASFLRTHYTAGSQSAAALAAYLLSVGDAPPPRESTRRRRGEPEAPAAARPSAPAQAPAVAPSVRVDDRFPAPITAAPVAAAPATPPVGRRMDDTAASQPHRGRRPEMPARVSTDPIPVAISLEPQPVVQPPAARGRAERRALGPRSEPDQRRPRRLPRSRQGEAQTAPAAGLPAAAADGTRTPLRRGTRPHP